MAEEVVYDWESAPKQMREAFEAQQTKLRALEEQATASAARLSQIDRREKFAEVKAALGDTAKDVTLEDLGDLPLDQITPTVLEVKALERVRARTAAEEAQAKALGYEDREAFVADLTRIREERARTTAAQGTIAEVASQGSAKPEVPKSAAEQMDATVRELRSAGLPQDKVEAAAFEKLLEAQMAAASTGKP